MDGQTKYKAKLDRLKDDTEYLDRLKHKYPGIMKWSERAFSRYDRDVDYVEGERV